ncbi:MAG: hypothetical protein E6H54_01190 [Betaproteobacteria bacterium]|nr:MAG: hypothetical protein E6H54_01190 [Betaproteobacteria bacterium]
MRARRSRRPSASPRCRPGASTTRPLRRWRRSSRKRRASTCWCSLPPATTSSSRWSTAANRPWVSPTRRRPRWRSRRQSKATYASSPSRTDMKSRRVELGYSAMRTIDLLTRAILATAGLTERDVRAVLVPNVVRGADDFASGASDMFFFAFGGPKVREIDASLPLRVLEIDEKGMAAARKITPYGFLTQVQPGPIYIGVEQPMKVYSFDNLFLTNSKVPDDLVYKILDTLEKNKPDLVAVQPVLRAFSAAGGYKQYDMPYHPGALKYYEEHKLQPKPLD